MENCAIKNLETEYKNKKTLDVHGENQKVKYLMFFEQENHPEIYANEYIRLSVEDVGEMSKSNIAKASAFVVNAIKTDNVDSLRKFEELNQDNHRYNNRVFSICASSCAVNCFEFFYSLLTDSELKQERNFSNLARDNIVQNLNYAGAQIYKAATSPSADKSFKSKKILEDAHTSIIPDNMIFALVIDNIFSNKSGVINMLKIFHKYKIVASDNQLYAMTQAGQKFSGYATIVFRYIHSMDKF